MGFSRQEYWSSLPFPPLGDVPDPGTEPRYPALAGRVFTTEPPGITKQSVLYCKYCRYRQTDFEIYMEEKLGWQKQF